jgi:ribosomal protein S18 acetylase RimI-like enzyme
VLLTEFRTELAARGIDRVRVSASVTQQNALRFYAKHGGKIVSEFDLGGVKTFTFVMPVAG